VHVKATGSAPAPPWGSLMPRRRQRRPIIVDLARATAALSTALEQDVGPAVTAADPKRVALQHDSGIVVVGGTGFLSPSHAAR
jgi:hypothetical protein